MRVGKEIRRCLQPSFAVPCLLVLQTSLPSCRLDRPSRQFLPTFPRAISQPSSKPRLPYHHSMSGTGCPDSCSWRSVERHVTSRQPRPSVLFSMILIPSRHYPCISFPVRLASLIVHLTTPSHRSRAPKLNRSIHCVLPSFERVRG